MNIFNYSLTCLAVAFVYYLSASLGLSLAFEQANTSHIWLPTGISIAAVLYFGYKVWPAIFIGALLINITAGSALSLATPIAIGSTLEALIAGCLLLRYTSRYPFEQITNTTLFVLILSLSTLINSAIAIGSLFLHHIVTIENSFLLWRTW